MKGFTLLELILAIMLLAALIFAVNSAELNARRFLNIDLARSVLIRDGSYVLDEMAKMIKMGSSLAEISESDKSGIQIVINDPTYGPREIRFYKPEDSNELYYDNPYLEILAEESFTGVLIKNLENFEYEISGNSCTLTLTLWDPDWEKWDPQKERAIKLSITARMENVP